MKRKNFSDITPYITAYISESAEAQLESYKDCEIDIADCCLFDGANAVINNLINKGFKFVDSKNKFNNEIFEHNRQLKKPDLTDSLYPDKYSSTLKELSETVNRLDEERVYNCRNSDDFPLVFMTQLFKPHIVWYIPEVLFTAFAEYAWRMLYYKNSAPSIMQFEKIMKNEDKMDILAYNSLYTFDKPIDFGIDNKCRLPGFTVSCTWGEAFYGFKILPFFLSRDRHVPESKDSPYYQVLKNIAESIRIKFQPKMDLKAFIEGGVL